MQIHEIQPRYKRKSKKRVGRGGNHGKTAGRGMNGQRAHASSAPRPEMRDRIKKIPKKRGYRFSSIQIAPKTLNLSVISQNFSAGQEVNPKALLKKALISRSGGKTPTVKILGMGELTIKNLVFIKCDFSETAKEKVISAGSKITV